MEPKFYNSEGFLTAYAFSCGYVEKKEIDSDNRKTMYKECSVYHVSGFKDGVHFGESFGTLSEAKRYFLSINLKSNK